MDKKNMLRKSGVMCLFAWVIVLILYHCGMRKVFGDDGRFLVYANQYSVGSWLNHTYHTWSSRIFADAAALIFAKFPIVVWKIFNIVAWGSIVISLIKLFEGFDRKYYMWFILCELLLYPFEYMGTAGWVTTQIYYVWPLAGLLIICLYIKKILLGSILGIHERITCLLMTLIIGTMEQMVVVLMLFWVSTLIYVKISGRKIGFLLLMVVTIVADLVWILTCPGNEVRLISEITQWMPDFLSLTIFDKINSGIVWTMSHFVYGADLIFGIYVLLNGYLAFTRTDKIVYRFIVMFAPVSTYILGVFKNPMDIIYPDFSNIIGTEVIKADNYLFVQPYISYLVYLLIITSIIMGIVISYGKSFHTLINITILAAGFGSCIMMGLSPTIYASTVRTLLNGYFALIACSIYSFSFLSERFKKNIIIILGNISFLLFLRELILIYNL